MTNRTLKTLSLSSLALALAAVASANEHKSVLDKTAVAAAAYRMACSAQQAIDRGWEYQRGLLEGRLEAKASQVLKVKGAIISPPFPPFASPRRNGVASTTPGLKNSSAIEHPFSH